MNTLLHICCAPCANQCIEVLRGDQIEVTGYWYNPNIHPYMEYKARRDCLKDYCAKINVENIFIEDEKYQAVELLTLYIKKLIFLTGKLGNPGLPDKLIFTLESLSREITGLFFEIGAKLGIDKSRIMLLDRKEGFYYYTLNQKQELWNHDVFLFDYRDENISCCHMKRNTKTVPQMITLDAKQRYMSKAGCDDSFYRILQDCFAGHSISSVYLVGKKVVMNCPLPSRKLWATSQTKGISQITHITTRKIWVAVSPIRRFLLMEPLDFAII